MNTSYLTELKKPFDHSLNNLIGNELVGRDSEKEVERVHFLTSLLLDCDETSNFFIFAAIYENVLYFTGAVFNITKNVST